IDGEILEQLVSLAKVNIKLRKNANSNSSSVDSIKGNIVTKSEERVSLLDSNFDPINFTEFLQAISNTYKQRRSQFYESFLKDRKYKSSSEDQKVERDLKLIELYSKYNELMQ
ncbi:DUF1357 family protein, partial [Borreliella valaisiana]|uniref:DUF1357 family protein n=1 Tax=Borreliella valaisiana TaxID=62088 RepID=UPI001AEFCD97